MLPFNPRKKKKKKKRNSDKTKKEKDDYSSVASASAAAAARSSLGAALRLPPGLPLLRPSAAFSFPARQKKKTKSGGSKSRREKLLNVHLCLPSFSSKPRNSSSSSSSSSSSLLHFKPPLPDSPTLSCACVSGNYRYHHYCQDGTDDTGWGCAYRSLQTLWSWFAENHFLDGGGEGKEGEGKKSTPPSHLDVQRALVSLGDKPPSFAGSTQWIGALEIGFVLDALAGVSCKVVTVPNGEEMATSRAAGALVHHFRTQGTPVMIGGGVLAYTCLGACFDSASGEASFLILDPHYRGTSDVDSSGSSSSAAAAAAAVVKGGWVAWKKPGDSAAAGGPLFVDGAFYNLLCPQRPERV